MNMPQQTQRRLHLLCLSLASLFFIGDLLVPLGVAGGVLYVVVVLITSWHPNARATLLWAAVGSGLTVLGFFLSPEGNGSWDAVTNRILALFAIWVTAILLQQRRHVEEALKESNARVRAILDTTVDAIITIDERGIVERFNQAAEQIFGYRAAEVVGNNISMLMPSPYREEHDDYLRRYLKTGERHIIGIGRETVGQRKDGSVFPIEISVSEVELDDRRLFTGIVRDITERRRLEKEILRISEEERRRIGHDLHEELGQMLTGITLINQNLARTLREERHPGANEAAQVTELIREADQYANDLTRGLIPVDLDATGLSVALQRYADETERLFGIQCTFEAQDPVLIHDNTVATHLYSIAREAVTHAVKYRNATHVTITLTSEGQHVWMQVRDNGNEARQEWINNTNGQRTGEQIMRYRARMIGARLDVRPDDSNGTTLTCTLRPLDSLGDGQREEQ